MRDENYFTVQGWMRTKLNLKGNELMLYAIIYGYSQDGKSKCKSSISYIMKALGVSNKTAIKIAKSLEGKNLIKKFESETGSEYITQDVNKVHRGGVKKVHRGCEESSQGTCEESSHNINQYNNNIIATASVAENPPPPLEPFNPKEYIAKMRQPEKKPHIRLIGWYFEMRKAEFPSLVAIRKEVARWVKDASYLAEFDPNKIARTYQYVEKKFPEDWNLSTIKKYISYEPR